MPEGVKDPRLDRSLVRAVPLIALLDGGIREPEGACVLFLEAGMVYMLSLGRRRPEPALYRFSNDSPARFKYEPHPGAHRYRPAGSERLSVRYAQRSVATRPPM